MRDEYLKETEGKTPENLSPEQLKALEKRF